MGKTLDQNKTLAFIKSKWYILLLIIIGMLSFTLNFFAISKYGYGNEYYAAAIKSMTTSFHNFFFVSFDPAGMVSVDKPPLGLWTQAISCLIFGYHGWAMLLPQALAGTASCIMIYILTAKYFGRNTGLIASFIFAVTPAVVVVSRNNTMDMQLIFVLLIATWFLFKAIEMGKWRFLFLAGVMVGIGFNIKMLQAYMVLPAFAIVYLIFAKEKILKRFLAGIITIVIVFAVSFSWVFAVDLYPSEDRPYVDSSTNNTVLELIIGHNGMERLSGRDSGGINGGNMQMEQRGERPQAQDGDENQLPNGKMDGGPNGEGGQMPDQMMNEDPNGGFNQPPNGMNGNQGKNGGGMGGDDIGDASLIRLWSSNIYGQISWLLVFCLFSIIVYIKKFDLKKLSIKHAVFSLWILWFATMFGFFSFAGFYHRYYLSMFAPAVAVLSAAGIVKMIKESKEKNKYKQLILPIAFIATMAIQIKYVLSYQELTSSLLTIMCIGAIVSITLMGLCYFKYKKLLENIMIVAIFIALLAAPFYWALTPVRYVMNTTMPAAGPEIASNSNDAFIGDNRQDNGLEDYLVKNYKEGSFLVVAQRSNSVAKYIIDTGLPVYAYGGFLGSDNSLTLEKLKELVNEGKIKYFLISAEGGPGNSSSEIESYVKENATLIDPSEYGGQSLNEKNDRMSPNGGTLYCFE